MTKQFQVITAVLGVVLTVALLGGGLAAAADINPSTDGLMTLQQVPSAIDAIEAPTLTDPQWYIDQVAAEKAAAAQSQATPVAPTGRVVTYTVSTKGATSANITEFAQQANQTLNDSRGWARLGFSFQQVGANGQFALVLSQASLVPSFSSACSADWSCRVGSSVIINDDRWMGATVAWNNAGGGLRDYRHYVVNHEVGHWLGHGHASCGGVGAAAPVMLQQSINLQGCRFNSWPLDSEVWTSR